MDIIYCFDKAPAWCHAQPRSFANKSTQIYYNDFFFFSTHVNHLGSALPSRNTKQQQLANNTQTHFHNKGGD